MPSSPTAAVPAPLLRQAAAGPCGRCDNGDAGRPNADREPESFGTVSSRLKPCTALLRAVPLLGDRSGPLEDLPVHAEPVEDLGQDLDACPGPAGDRDMPIVQDERSGDVLGEV